MSTVEVENMLVLNVGYCNYCNYCKCHVEKSVSGVLGAAWSQWVDCEEASAFERVERRPTGMEGVEPPSPGRTC